MTLPVLPLFLGNWKMNHGPRAAREFCEVFRPLAADIPGVEIGLAPPFLSLPAAAAALEGSGIALAAQDVFFEASGAFTGEISAGMLRECGCRYVIVGHSERRTLFAETDSSARQKVRAVLREGMQPVLCIGETLQERESHRTLEVVGRQLDKGLEGLAREKPLAPAGGTPPPLHIAYEPVWAIGTGRAATEKEIAEVHSFVRRKLTDFFGPDEGARIRILYGGSVKPENVGGIAALPDVNGGLVGGASLDPKAFAELCRRVPSGRRS